MVTRVRSLRADFSFASGFSRSLSSVLGGCGCGSGDMGLAGSLLLGWSLQSEVSADVINASLALVHFGGKDEIIFTQSIDVMCPEPQSDFSICQVNIGMMILSFGYFAHAVGESQRFAEVVEGVLLFEVMFVDDLPITIQLEVQIF